jgi:prevent-host-death family protein
MDKISVADANAHLSAILDRVAQGDEVVITRRGTPVARLTGVDAPSDHDSRNR